MHFANGPIPLVTISIALYNVQLVERVEKGF